MKFGTVGTGWITDEFVKGTRLIDNFNLGAVYSRNKETGEKFAQKYGCPAVYTDLNKMAESSDIDAVYIASPNSFHYEQSRIFLENGKHVLCEKPATVTPVQLEELTQLAEEKGLIYLEAIMMLHQPALKKLEKALSKIGKITTARFDFSQLSSKYQSLIDGKTPNIFNPEFKTGCFMDLGIYCIYPALHLFGIPHDIMATAGFLSTGADGYGSSIFVYPDFQLSLSYSKIGQSRLGSEIMGDNGTVVIGSISKLTDMKIIYNDGSEEIIEGDIPKEILMSREAESFYRFITEKKKYSAEYRYASELSIRVCGVMERMRRMAGIGF